MKLDETDFFKWLNIGPVVEIHAVHYDYYFKRFVRAPRFHFPPMQYDVYFQGVHIGTTPKTFLKVHHGWQEYGID